jgi:hypothetical protein
MNVVGTGSDSALLSDGEERSGLIDPDDLTRCADELAEKKRHMAQASAQIEHPHPGRDTGAAQEQGRRQGDAGGLGVQPGQFGFRRPQRIRLRLGHGSRGYATWEMT